MVDFNNCSAPLAGLNASLFNLAELFVFETLEEFRQYADACRIYQCNNQSAATVAAAAAADSSLRFCAASMDRVAAACWPLTAANENAFISCPHHITGFNPDRKASRICGEDGIWRNVSYHDCYVTDVVTYAKVLLCYSAGSVSIASCLLAFIILHVLHILHCGRVTLHKHFFLSNAGYSACWILKYAVVERVATSGEPVWCHIMRGVEVLTAYFTVTNILWMFSEGLFLYAHVVLGFVSEQNLLRICMAFGWGLPLVPTIVFISRAAMLSEADKSQKAMSQATCWTNVMGDTIVNYSVLAPIALALLVNFYFLVHILIILWMKMRGVTEHSRETNQTAKAVRAVLILFPLLGIQQLFLAAQPDQNNNFFPAYEIISMLFTSCQGTFVAVLFCFANGEVIAALKRKSRIFRWLFKPCMSMSDDSQATRNSSLPSNHTTASGEHRPVACSYSRLSVQKKASNALHAGQME